MPGYRQERIRQRLFQEINLIFARELSDPRVVGVTATRVEMSADLRFARIHIAPQPTPAETDEMLEGLEHAAGFIRHRITLALDLKHATDVQFKIDRAIEKGDRFLRVLEQVQAEERAAVSEKKARARKSSRKKTLKRKK